MTRILLVTDLFFRQERTGLDIYCDQLVYWLPRLARETDFVLTSFGEYSPNLPVFAENLRYQPIPISRRELYFRAIISPLSILTHFAEPFDLVHLLVPLPVRATVPLVTTVHDLGPVLFPNLYSWQSRWLFKRTLHHLATCPNTFLAVSDCTARDLEKHFHVSAEVIHEGIDDSFRPITDDERVRQKYSLPERYFLCLGSLHKRKNLGTILSAYRRFQALYGNDIQLVLAGRMSLGERDTNIAMEKDVTVAGYIDQVDLPAIIGMAEALLYPSYYEGFGLPVLEAMACGTPVIAARTGAIPEIAGKNALLCDPQDIDCFADSMVKVASNAELRAQLTQQGLFGSKNFSWQKTAQKTLQVYEMLIR